MVLPSPGAMAARRNYTKGAWIDLRSWPTAIVAGVVGGLMVLSTSISYPALIFTGAFEPYLGIGIEMALFGTAVLAAVVAVGSSYPAAIANVQIETAVVLGIQRWLLRRPRLGERPGRWSELRKLNSGLWQECFSAPTLPW
jgi:hypothetical protein